MTEDLVLSMFDFLSGEDRLKVELCLNRRLKTRVFYKLLIEEQHRYEKYTVYVTVMKGDMWWAEWDHRSEIKLKLVSNSSGTGVHTIIRWTHSLNCPPYQSRKIIMFQPNMTTRGATRRVIKLLRDGKLDLHMPGEIHMYNTLRRMRQ